VAPPAADQSLPAFHGCRPTSMSNSVGSWAAGGGAVDGLPRPRHRDRRGAPRPRRRQRHRRRRGVAGIGRKVEQITRVIAEEFGVAQLGGRGGLRSGGLRRRGVVMGCFWYFNLFVGRRARGRRQFNLHGLHWDRPDRIAREGGLHPGRRRYCAIASDDAACRATTALVVGRSYEATE
jgi:hypothetical protein